MKLSAFQKEEEINSLKQIQQKKKHPSSSGMQSVGSIFIHQRYSQILTRYLCNANTSINPEFNLSVFYTSNNKEEIT